MKSPSGWSASAGSKPIDGVMVGSTWSPAKSSPAGAVGEDVVALGVAGRVDRVDGAVADGQRDVALQPGVGVVPHRQVGRRLAA